ncbi:hypothetical protein ACKVMT_14245 [Halobacteriales archaeon Cl-PHB]
MTPGGAGQSVQSAFGRDGTTVAACLGNPGRVAGLDAATGDSRDSPRRSSRIQ